MLIGQVGYGLAALANGDATHWQTVAGLEILRNALWLVFVARLTPAGQGIDGLPHHLASFAPAAFVLVHGLGSASAPAARRASRRSSRHWSSPAWSPPSPAWCCSSRSTGRCAARRARRCCRWSSARGRAARLQPVPVFARPAVQGHPVGTLGRAALRTCSPLEGVIAVSPAMQEVCQKGAVAMSDRPSIAAADLGLQRGAQAAALVGVSRPTVYDLISRHDVHMETASA